MVYSIGNYKGGEKDGTWVERRYVGGKSEPKDLVVIYKSGERITD